MNWIVLEANYHGDQYVGADFETDTGRYLDRDLHTKELQDIQMAGEYAKTIPNADPKRIIFMGHSNGSILGSLYITDPSYADKILTLE